jgi:hypothetical protein
MPIFTALRELVLMSKTPHRDRVAPEDYEAFIADLQQIIENAPAGYQAKYARVVSELQQKRLTRIAELKGLMHPEDGEGVNYDLLLKMMTEDVNDRRTSPQARFDSALKLAKLREEMPKENKPRKKSIVQIPIERKEDDETD